MKYFKRVGGEVLLYTKNLARYRPFIFNNCKNQEAYIVYRYILITSSRFHLHMNLKMKTENFM